MKGILLKLNCIYMYVVTISLCVCVWLLWREREGGREGGGGGREGGEGGEGGRKGGRDR